MKNIPGSFPIIRSCIILSTLGVMMSSCTVNPASWTTAATNTPVIASVPNTFTFVLDANNYTQNQNWALTFTTDSLVLSVVSSNHESGSFSYSVTDSTNTTILQGTITTNTVIATTQTGLGIPKYCTVNCSQYAGNVTFTLSKNQ